MFFFKILRTKKKNQPGRSDAGLVLFLAFLPDWLGGGETPHLTMCVTHSWEIFSIVGQLFRHSGFGFSEVVVDEFVVSFFKNFGFAFFEIVEKF